MVHFSGSKIRQSKSGAIFNAEMIKETPEEDFNAEIIIESNSSYILDNGSTNGVYINEILITDKAALNSGDKLQIGKFLLLFTKV